MVEQDLTVQIIKNEFTAEVYEDNMLFCLKQGDFLNFERCGQILLTLYGPEKIESKRKEKTLFLLSLNGVLCGKNNFERLFLLLLNWGLLPFEKWEKVWKIWRNVKIGNFLEVFIQFDKEEDEYCKIVIEKHLDALRLASIERICLGFQGKTFPMKDLARMLFGEDEKAKKKAEELLEKKSKNHRGV